MPGSWCANEIFSHRSLIDRFIDRVLIAFIFPSDGMRVALLVTMQDKKSDAIET